MDDESKIAILILAAGESKRMGEPKQLLPWQETTLLGHAITVAKSVCQENTYVVLGGNAKEIRESINLGDADIIYNPDYKTGQGSSLRTGIDFLIGQREEYTGVLIMLCDQPLITKEYLKKMLKAFKEGQKVLVATEYANGLGVPAVFQNKYFNELKSLKGDRGAKEILNKNKADVLLLDAEGGELDIDTAEEYQRLTSKAKS